MTRPTTTQPITSQGGASVLKCLRALTPTRNCTFEETLQVAERQATRLVSLLGATNARRLSGDEIQWGHIDAMPRLRVVFEPLPVSGMSHWNGQEWVLAISSGDSPARQRFTLLHEFKHIVDHGQTARLYTGSRAKSAQQQAETAADYFAGCALIPRRQLKSAWGNGIQRTADLAAHFGVSEQAIQVRLAQTGLDRESDRPTVRCVRPIHTRPGAQQRFAAARPGYRSRRYA